MRNLKRKGIKILSVVGARPQFIKEAMLQIELRKKPEIEEVLVHTGQHFDDNMSDSFFDILEIKKPEYFLNINNKSHGEMTGLMMIELEKIFKLELPDYVIVYGDTNSTLAAALVARKLNIKVIHIEAGLRQEPKSMPEEINRVLTDHSSTILFAPSNIAVENLYNEGIINNVFNVGDIMYDLYLEMEKHFDNKIFNKYSLEKNKYILVTIHRDFNVDDRNNLQRILEKFKEISKTYRMVLPLHPRTRDRIIKYSLSEYLNSILVINPLNYFQLMGLLKNSYKIITDSGGLQKEAYYSNKEACVLMPDTCWSELITSKYNTLVNIDNLVDSVLKKPNKIIDRGLYGKGNTAKKIIEIILNDYLKENV